MNHYKKDIFLIIILVFAVMILAVGLAEIAVTGYLAGIIVLLLCLLTIFVLLLRQMVKIDYEENSLIIKKIAFSKAFKKSWKILMYDEIKTIEFIRKKHRRVRFVRSVDLYIRIKMKNGRVETVTEFDSMFNRTVRKLLSAYDDQLIPENLIRKAYLVKMRNFINNDK